MEKTLRHIGKGKEPIVFLRKISVEPSVLYYVLIGSVLLLLISSFFIQADVGVRTRGILRGTGERIVVTAPFEGILSSAVLEENRVLQEGDTLFSVRTDQLNVVHEEMSFRFRQTDTLLADLYVLLQGKGERNLSSRFYRAEYRLYSSQLSELKAKTETEKKIYDRYRKLFESRLVSLADFEKYESSYRSRCNETASFRSEKRSQWEREIAELEMERRQLREQLSRISLSEADSYVLAPADAAVLNVFHVKDGQYVHQGQQIAELTPMGDIMLECQVASSDIGLLSEGQKARIMVDAFNYNDWGVVSGKVAEISEDANFIGEGGSYSVLCSLDRDYVELSNGYRRYLKKGMTVSARFIVTKRTLFSLVFERLDDWINPEVLR